MKVAIEMFSMIIAITLACILFASIISSNNQVSDARDFYNVVVNRIEDSNCNNQVIEQCQSEAKEKGYELNVEDLTIYNEQPSRFVTLKYSVVIPVFSLFGDEYNKQGVVEGYAR
jgi:c-di-GMP-related signal transduction protein